MSLTRYQAIFQWVENWRGSKTAPVTVLLHTNHSSDFNSPDRTAKGKCWSLCIRLSSPLDVMGRCEVRMSVQGGGEVDFA